MGDLVDSSETVPVCFAALLFPATLISALVLLKLALLICVLMIIYSVVFDDFAVEILRVDVHC